MNRWSQKNLMSPLQSCLVGQTKPFGEKNQQDQPEKNQTTKKNWNGYFGHFRALAENSYIFILASLEPKLFFSKSSTQH